MNGWTFKNWIAVSWERSHPGQHILIGVEKLLYKARSAFQDIVIADTPGWGRGLFLDGNPQLFAFDEFIYHEHLALLPLLYHPDPRRVLIIGGGDGLALREILRDRRVREVVLVDIDEQVVAACRDLLADLHRGSFDDPRARIVIADAREFLAGDCGFFDVTLLDLIDAETPAESQLYLDVIGLLKQRLAANALVTSNAVSVDPPRYLGFKIQELLRVHFSRVEIYRAYIPAFAREWAFLLATDQFAAITADPQVLLDRCRHLRGELRALQPQCFPQAFQLPPYLAEIQARFRAGETPTAEPAEFAWFDQ